jgi:hypothetical protein
MSIASDLKAKVIKFRQTVFLLNLKEIGWILMVDQEDISILTLQTRIRRITSPVTQESKQSEVLVKTQAMEELVEL